MANQSFTVNIKALFDASDVKAKVGDIQNALKNIKLPDDLKRSLDSSFTNVNKALDEFNSKVNKGVKSKADATGISKSFDSVVKELDTLDKLMAKVKGELGDGVDLSKIIRIDDATRNKVNQLKQDIANLQKEISKITAGKLNELQQALAQLKTPGAIKGAKDAFKFFEEGDVQSAINLIEQLKNKYIQLEEAYKQKGKDTTNVHANVEAFKLMQAAMESVLPKVQEYNSQIGEKATQAANELNNAQQRTAQGTRDLADGFHEVSQGASRLAPDIHAAVDAQAQFVREIDQVKSRIQYFFGITNAINLIKRAIRGAVDTVKELDKAMTETAVVTNYTISDMWKQLPDYTKRANELGVTTKDAYEAATLYYQQGLNTEQAAALSTETLKMARIAGLDAAEATDRMTNALRGFNMELNEVSAQRIDDVYSQLAAMSASNVDEISTAMTKVASLAHNANMDFETTSAFLAQIIETTRESAETAGTALKTVVARFSEVKKLYDMDELKGKDEEGQSIDVNRVSSALRTAGIDLNKYFLGEVGLDDIFLELASKWDSLTSVQQRYIATQAAGSRQQSRFIALMQDYARTQELVSAAYNANGASAKQFEKTQDSLQSKLARLKNAWDQFLMGLANNSIIKSAVDLLTLLLNGVNKLTEAFGTGAGSILKWIAVISAFRGIKGLFAGGGLLDRGIMTALAGTGLGNAMVKVGLLSGLGLGTGNTPIAGLSGAAQQTAAANAGAAMAQRTPLIFGSGSVLSKAGKGLWGNSKALGLFMQNGGLAGKVSFSGAQAASGFAGIGAGITGIATALGAVAVAIGIVVAGYQAWLRLTPEGQLKQAKQLAEVMNNVAANTQKNASEFKKATQDYQEYDNAVKSATSTAEYQKAVTDRTNYVSELIKNNPNFAKYVKASSEDGQYTLTIKQEDLEKASEEAAKNASKAAADASFSSALVAGKQADVYEAQLIRNGVNLKDNTIYDSSTETYRQLTGAELAKYSDIQRQIDASRAEEISYAQQAFSRQLEGSGLDDDISNLLSSALAKSFDEDEYLSKINAKRAENWWGGQATRGALEAQYYSLYGQQADASMKRGELARAVAQAQVNEEQQKNVTNKVAELVKNGDYDSILKAIAGEIDFSEEDMAAANDKLQKFADALGQDISEIQNQIRTNQKARQEIKKSNQANIFEQALKSGHNINQAFVDTIKGLDFDQLNIVSDIINQAAGKVSEQTFQSLFDTLPEMSNESLKEIQSFFNTFDLNDPISALDQLNNKIEEVGANSSFGKLLVDIKETNAGLFESSNLVQSFLLSDSYEQLSDSIEEVTKNNKKLNGKNIEDMAESCHELETLLKEINEDLGENTDSAQALAEAINLIGEGSLAIDQITNSLLAALGAGESFESLIGNVQQWIEDFDKGTDLTEGTQHITSVLEEAGKYVESWQFGNEPLQNIYDHIFGEGAYDAYMKENWGKKSFDQLETEIGGEIQRISSMAENEGLGALQFLSTRNIGITDNGNNEFSWDLSQYKNQENPVQAAIQDVATQLKVTEDVARAFIESWASHMYDLRQEWNDLNFTDAMTAFSDELGNSAVITQAELDALIAKTGKTREEILSALTEIRGQGNVPIVVSWQDENGGNLSGKDLIDKFNDAAGVVKDKYTPTGETEMERSPMLAKNWSKEVDYSSFLDENKLISTFEDAAGKSFESIDYNALHQHLTEAYKLSPQQADEIANNIAESTEQGLSQTIEIPVMAEDGTIQMEPATITGDTAEAVQAGIEAAQEAAKTDLIAQKLATTDFSSMGTTLEGIIASAGSAGGQKAADNITAAVNAVNATITVDWQWGEKGPPSAGGSTGGSGEIPVTGGIVGSYAKGSENFHISPGTSLIGEEGPEIVWNKDGKYAYLTGQNGPEFTDLHPGDRIFNAAETRRIIRNSHAAGGYVDSFASGGWKTGSSNKKSGGGSGGSGGGADDKTPEEWKNDLDWLYNLMEDIAELERDQKAIEEQYEDYLSDQTKTGGDLYRLLVKQLGNLYTQLEHQNFALQKREQEMREFMDVTNDQDQYLWYNWQDRTLEIDWDAIDQIRDEEQYKHVKELIDEAEEIQDKMDDADDAIMDITNQIQELENIWRDTFTDFEDRVLDAIIKSYQQVIDKYSELNDTLNNSNSQILDSLQKQISLERQIRDNTKTEEEISDEEARLAYLRRDTSGGNELAALQLERELADQRENYEDTLVDQAISRLQEDNDAAAQQRERQIEIMQAQLDYQSENGEFNAYISDLLTAAMGADGELLTNSDLVTLLKEQENWDAMSDVSKQVWDEELNGTFKEVAAFLLKQNAEQNGTFYTALTAAVKSVSSAIGSYSQAMVKLGSELSGAGGYSDAGGGGGYDGNGTPPPPEDPPPVKKRLGGCFASGTKILMADNSTKNIEFIKIGDTVIAYNELTREFVPKKVTKSYIHYNTPAMVKLTFVDNSILELTPGHPLYSTHGWKSLDIENSLYEHGTIATLLHIGDEIIGIHGNRIVKSIEWLNIGTNYNSYNIEVEDCHTFLANGLVAHNVKVNLVNRFATGGLADSTGLAWLDGTPQEPEYVLNARQTDAFLKLADVLPSMMNSTSTSTSNTFGATYVNLSVNLESVSPDYDVDRMVDLVKDKLYDAGSYRNINSLSFLR